VSSILRMSILLVFWAICAVISCITKDVESKEIMIVSMPNKIIFKKISFPHDVVNIELFGPINKPFTDKKLVKNSPSVNVRAEWRDSTLEKIFVRSPLWKVYLLANSSEFWQVSQTLKLTPLKSQVSPSDEPYGYPESEPISVAQWGHAESVVSVESQSPFPVGLEMVLNNAPGHNEMGVIYTIILIITLYALVISEYIDRRFGCVLLSIAGLTLLSCLGRRPSFDTIAGSIDFGVLMVLLGSMIMVALMWENGFFDYITLVAYKASKGHAWLLIYLLAMITAFLAAILDNVTVFLLIAPASVKLCEAAFLNTKIILITLALYAQMGGSMTPVGAPANIVIINQMAREQEINFSTFTAHMLPAAVMCMLTVYGLLFLCVGSRIYKVNEHQLVRRRKMKQPTQDILDRMEELKKRPIWIKPVPNYYNILATVEANQTPMNLILLAHIGIAFLFIIAGFILRSMPTIIPNASFGWISMLAAFLLLILANKPNISPVLARIEWGVLIYVASMFIITEVIVELGFISWLGELTTKAVMDVDINHQTISSMLIVLWLSALFSSILDNTPVAVVLLQVCIKVAHSEDLNVPLMSLVWALLLGTNYGGMGSLLGSLANEFVPVVAKEHGYIITFMDFFYMGFPIMIFNLIVSSLYLLTAQNEFGINWN
ncbi:hypothetical protein KR032_008084, partial [Drosophila birchii]